MSETIEHDSEQPSGEVEPHPADDPAGGVPMHGMAAAPQIKATDLVNRLGTIREAMNTAMVKDVDYGVVPGTDKPTLLKPGSEKLGVLFQLDIQLDNEKLWGPGEHLTVISRATAYHAPTGTRLGYGEGMCSTREKKYAYRKQERTCPQCGAHAIIKGKAEYGGGWLCWKKKGGCGAKFNDGAAEIENQPQGEVENPDLPDCWNTVIKMSEKRARVDCVLAVTGASALFTQDVEDMPEFQGNWDAPPTPQPPSDDEKKPSGSGQQHPVWRTEPLTDSEIAHIRQLMADTDTDEQTFCAAIAPKLSTDIPDATYIPPAHYEWACKQLNIKAKKMHQQHDDTLKDKGEQASDPTTEDEA